MALHAQDSIICDSEDLTEDCEMNNNKDAIGYYAIKQLLAQFTVCNGLIANGNQLLLLALD